ncbi:glycosyl transferase family 2 [Prosthecobacter fusiformis]|uniref:Glycosyl transferase family 2 n=1 Tax=Prosthecobacter fusiformis TaxID=48464 RepID=A0A4R7RZU0_9BACT|nr:glycosyltransferase family A protein [Prosthecobacter fusiformis]TDU71401.1 glycosyl transferase family 2 [Prosthecobacter fusiformis]
MSEISVIIPAYNRDSLIRDTLLSILGQSVPAFEIIVVDDGSTDRTAEVAEACGKTVRVIRQTNAGPAAARNRGFRESTGDYIHFFDSDDIALPNKHEVQLRALEQSGADIAYGPWIKGRISQRGFEPENAVLQQLGLPKGDLVQALLTNWSIVPHACLFRRSIVEKSGGFPEHLYVAEDQLMFLRCLLAGARVVHSPGTLELYRVDNSDKLSTADSNRTRHLTHWAQFLIDAEHECAKNGIRAIDWFGYRRRLWEAREYLVKDEVKETDIVSELSDLLGGPGGDSVYYFEKVFQKIRRSLGLGRQHPSFGCGPIDADQARILDGFTW